MKSRDWRLKPGSFRARRLAIEALEHRNLLAVMRIVDWNTMNGPNDAAGDANYSTIFQAIGNETVQGNTKRIDILALEETDPPGPGGNSIGRINTDLNTLYPAASYSFVVTPVDGGGDSTGFVYDTTTVTLLNSMQVDAGSVTHNIMRAEFRPIGTTGDSDFYIYSIHLKSGDGGAEATTRGQEAALLRADADSLGQGANVLFVGDFNMKTSAEAAYQAFVSAGPGQLQDVADAPGNWYNNPAFKNLHSQDPQTAMDDRFDIQFASGEFFDGTGVDYVPDSFHIFGNNGTHTFDAPITTGTGASPAVLNALVAASDHLPAVADYQIIDSTPNVRITETVGGTKVVEGGLYDTYQVVLDTVPTANVNVTVMPDSQVDIGNGAGVAEVFTFTPANALTPQTVVVHAVDDALAEGDHTGLITHSSSSADASYNGLTIAPVNVSIVDNDAPKWVINEADVDQVGTDTQEFVEIYDGGAGHVSLNGLTLVLFKGSTDTAYTVVPFGPSDFTDANGFFVVGDSAVSPTPNQILGTSNTIQQGPGAIALYSGSFSNGSAVTTTNLIDALVYDTGQADDAGLLVLLQAGQPQINENQNSLGTTQSMSRVPDGGAQRQTTTYVEQTPTPGMYNQLPHVGVQIIQSASRVDVEEGGTTDSYQIALESIPTANVTITVDPDDQTDLGAGAGVAITLIFTPSNALIPQTVNVAAVDDLAIEGDHTSTLTQTATSADARYNGISIGNVIANIKDNDFAAPASVVISEIMYNPASDETAPGVGEWMEIVNTGSAAVDISGWLFDDEDATNWSAIPNGNILNPYQAAVIFDADFTTAATFRSEWSVPSSSLVIGVSWGSLSNSPGPGNEVIQLLNNLGVQMDVVNYDDASPWPGPADGPSIYLKNLNADNSNGANWARSVVGINGAVSPTGPTFSTADVGSPGRFTLPSDYNSNGVVDAADYVLWRHTLGSTTDLRADASGPTTGVSNGVVDQPDYDYWRANFGAVVPTYGSGSGSVVGVGAALVESSTTFSVSESAAMAVAPDAPPAQSAAVDSAMASGFAFSLTDAKAPSRSIFARESSPSVDFGNVDLLLMLGQATYSQSSFQLAEDVSKSSPAAEDGAIDAHFAKLGDDGVLEDHAELITL
ncbi:MAG TPA: lamin tail domain-containing protein [Lacipirellulaceae bacterium]|jgi:endonuclease/exonuclease/phosphatase family metal-dependent hydrolase|nr:lamin tail domain-containing protein [Lacipirellulaceae bacterium]